MSSEITASVSADEDHGYQSRELLISIRETDPPYEGSIYQVPNRLRMVNEKAYIPQLVSIGPLHHGKEELAGMEKRKASYLIHFFKRTSLTKQDLLRCAFLQNYPSKNHQKGYITKIPNAVKLYGSGVKFKRHDVPDCLLDIRLGEQKQRIPCFKVKELKLPFLPVDDNTEPLLRNIMALEQLHYSNDAWICSYVKLLDYFIETEEDVDLLHGKGIIENCLGDNASVANIFNKICNEISLTESSYYNITRDLKAHYRNPWNHSKAKLSSVYFNDLWTGTASVAAIVLLLLTVTQTVFSIL
ncbi:putative UPF0481 protein At3g02645 [Mangifera indica]|uniref:putative UPF0481 protein At3g02645 n=1 Tax=Mangifera indica TaxID=29780 RepID=UPI001CFBA474|nr:putative UPF0481 protein At3g02645 [Mangifera indica]